MRCDKCDQRLPNKINKIIKIKELGIEIETLIHNKGECLSDIKIPHGYRLPTYYELQTLRNSKKYCKKLYLDDTWEFVEQPDNICKAKGYVARFGVTHDLVSLCNSRNPRLSDSDLGVRFCRSLKK